MPADVEDLVRDGIAARAWITDSIRWRDSEGIEVRARLAFEVGQHLMQVVKSYSFDAYHAYVGSGEYMSWFDANMKTGGNVTVLWPQGRPRDFVVYGDLELILPGGGFAAQ